MNYDNAVSLLELEKDIINEENIKKIQIYGFKISS